MLHGNEFYPRYPAETSLIFLGQAMARYRDGLPVSVMTINPLHFGPRRGNLPMHRRFAR